MPSLKGIFKSVIARPWENQFVRHAFIYFVGDLLVRAGFLIFVPIYTRALSREEYGTVAIASLVSTMVSYIAGSTLSAAVLKLTPEYRSLNDPGYVVDNLVKLVITWNVCLCSLLLAIAPIATRVILNSVTLVPSVRIAIGTGCLTGLTTILLATFQSRHCPVRYRLVTISSFTANLATGLVAVLYLKMGGYGAVLGQLVGAACACIVAIIVVGINFGRVFDAKVARQALNIGFPLAVYSVGGFSTDQLSRIFIERDVSVSALGVYNIAFLYCTAVGLLFTAINTAWVPRFFSSSGEIGLKESGVYGTAVMIGAIGMGSIMVLLSPLLIGLVAGHDYQAARFYIPAMMINALLGGPIWSLFMNPLVFAGKNWCIAACAVIGGACNLLLNELLTNKLGLWGAIFSSMIALSILTLLTANFSLGSYKVKYGYKRVAGVAFLLVAICGFSVVFLPFNSFGNLLKVSFAILCAALTYRAISRIALDAPAIDGLSA